MNLERVKEHFKYAKEVRCLNDGEIYLLPTNRDIKADKNNTFCFLEHQTSNWVVLYNGNKLAEILTYIFERGEEVEVKDTNDTLWSKAKFISFSFKNKPIVEYSDGLVLRWEEIRKLTPESKLEPQLSELKKVAEANGMSVTVIFNQK